MTTITADIGEMDRLMASVGVVADQAKGFSVSETDLFVDLAGTAARFLTALCAAAPSGLYRIDGVPQMPGSPEADADQPKPYSFLASAEREVRSRGHGQSRRGGRLYEVTSFHMSGIRYQRSGAMDHV